MLSFQTLKNWINERSDRFWIVCILCVAALIRIGFLIQPSRPWWDATVYQGMARFIASGGAYGAWEFFRPPLWPLILTPFSWAGPFAMEWIAKFLTVIFSLGAIYCVYRIGKVFDKRAGMLAATLLSLSVPFLAFSTIPMTEVLSTFLVIAGALLLVKGKWFWAGLIAGLSFIVRFPAGILLPAFAIATIVTVPFSDGFYTYAKNVLYRGLMIGVGFGLIAIPYFISNSILYGSMTSPLVAGTGMITGFLWLYKGDGLFYIKNILNANPVSLFIIPGILFPLLSWRSLNKIQKRAITVAISAIILFVLYFSLQAHKEFRYIMPALPSIFVLSGIGFTWISKKWNKKAQVFGALALAGIAFFVSIAYRHEAPTHGDAIAIRQFYSALSNVTPGARVISSTPAIAAFSPVRLVEGYNTWAQMNSSYNEAKNLDYVAIDSCELHACKPGHEMACKADEQAFLTQLSSDGELVYDSAISSCRLMIYKLHTSR